MIGSLAWVEMGQLLLALPIAEQDHDVDKEDLRGSEEDWKGWNTDTIITHGSFPVIVTRPKQVSHTHFHEPFFPQP